MYKVETETLEQAYKPFDIVSDKDGNVGFIKEVSVNTCQPSGLRNQISYSVHWLVRVTRPHTAWYYNDQLIVHSNLFVELAKTACHPASNSSNWVEKLFKSF